MKRESVVLLASVMSLLVALLAWLIPFRPTGFSPAALFAARINPSEQTHKERLNGAADLTANALRPATDSPASSTIGGFQSDTAAREPEPINQATQTRTPSDTPTPISETANASDGNSSPGTTSSSAAGTRAVGSRVDDRQACSSGMNAQYLGVVENGGNVTTLSTILEVAEVLGADAGEMIREVAAARRPVKPTGT